MAKSGVIATRKAACSGCSYCSELPSCCEEGHSLSLSSSPSASGATYSGGSFSSASLARYVCRPGTHEQNQAPPGRRSPARAAASRLPDCVPVRPGKVEYVDPVSAQSVELASGPTAFDHARRRRELKNSSLRARRATQRPHRLSQERRSPSRAGETGRTRAWPNVKRFSSPW